MKIHSRKLAPWLLNTNAKQSIVKQVKLEEPPHKDWELETQGVNLTETKLKEEENTQLQHLIALLCFCQLDDFIFPVIDIFYDFLLVFSLGPSRTKVINLSRKANKDNTAQCSTSAALISPGRRERERESTRSQVTRNWLFSQKKHKPAQFVYRDVERIKKTGQMVSVWQICGGAASYKRGTLEGSLSPNVTGTD